MNQHLQSILNYIQKNENISEDDKDALILSAKNADKELEITAFKLERTEKVKRTAETLLEETIDELEQKRKAVEAQNRELEIESSLERVRTTAMSMRKPDDLMNICETMFKELKALGFNELRNTMIQTFVDEKKYVIDYDYSDTTGGGISYIPYTGNPAIEKFMKDIRTTNDAFTETVIRGKELDSWKEFRKTSEQLDDARLDEASELYYYMYSIGVGDIGISTFSSISEDKSRVLKRFRNTFDFAYRRYTDVAQAEAQAREAEIELALERVRASTMSMQKSDELRETSLVLFQQLKELGEPAEQSTIGIINEEEGVVEVSATLHGSKLRQTFKHSIHEPVVMNKMYNGWKEQRRSMVLELKGESLETYNKYRNELVGTEMFPTKLTPQDCWIIHAAYFSKGMVVLSTNELRPKESMQLLERFASVFDLTYTRFLDLQKAEAQAKEAQIEAALEKVRSSSLAMHHSSELEQVAGSLFDRLVELGLSFDGAFIFIFDKEKRNISLWIATNHLSAPVKINLPYDKEVENNTIIKDLWNAIENGEHIIDRSYSGEVKNEYFRYVAKYNESKIPESIRQFQIENESWTLHVAAEKNSTIGFDSWSGHPTKEEDFKNLIRFARVFEQAYTRFLDLQKSEAQTRDSQIELGLERVRASAMAMQTTDELKALISTVFTELTKLDMVLIGCVIMIFDPETESSNWWMANYEAPAEPLSLYIKNHDSRPYREFIKAWKDQKIRWEFLLEGDEKKEWDEFLFTETELSNIPANVKTAMRTPERILFSTSFNNFGCLNVGTFEPLSENQFDILLRFAKVFDLTYRRFHDLQKAEAQTREAKIEVSLERVRSAAMAMHKSDDLHGAVKVMFEEFQKLNLDILRCGVGILNKASRTGTVWATSVSESGLAVQISANESFDTHPLMRRIYEFWQKQEDLDYVLQGQDLIDYYKAMGESEFKLPQSQLPSSEDNLTPQHYYAAMFQAGGLYAFRDKPFDAEDIKIMKRFASVLNLTYNRFLDLQKAEAQIREAQIEAALERVRAKAMAMHKSEDVNAAVGIVFEELDKSNLGILRCGIAILNKEKRSADVWSTTKSDKGLIVQVSGDESIDIHPMLAGAFDAWVNHEEDYTYDLYGDDLIQYYKSLGATNFNLPEELHRISSDKRTQQHFFVATFSAGCLFAFRQTTFPEEAKRLMKRFAGVFNLTYKRFIDLQKAEAQAKEAKIEAALERVRAQSMAMHTTTDLMVAASLLFNELKKLGLPPISSGYSIVEEKQGRCTQYEFNEDGSLNQNPWSMSLTETKVLRKRFESWKRKDPLYVEELKGQENIEHHRYVAEKTTNFPLPAEQFLSGIPDHVVFYTINFAQGYLIIITGEKISAEMEKTAVRFGKVFEQTYTRFLDLQKAEAQAREAQIEAALERVRSSTLAMHSSEGLLSVTQVLREQMALLGEKKLESILIHIYNEETYDFEAWYSYRNPEDPDGKIADGKVILNWNNTDRASMDKKMYHSQETDYTIVADREMLTEWYKYLETVVPEVVELDNDGNILVPDVLYYNYSKFSGGALLLITNSEASGSSKYLLKRSAKVFNLAYTRFIDLRKAEAQTKEAIKQASVDRVRGEIASMRSTADLEKITPLIWNELTTLGVQFMRCGVFIMDETLEQINTLLSTPDGKAIAAFHLSYNTPGTIKHILKHWYKKEIYKEFWDKAAFNEWTKNLIEQGAITSSEKYLTENRPANLHLHFLPFLQGMFYVGSEAPLREEEIILVKTLADSFSTAYARYEDFNKLEFAKEQIEKTLVDLKQTQVQLIQSEKMASLGELTAGIAHEIQNPLNFVNNFAEVNTEMIADLKQEIDKGNFEEVRAIATGLEENEQKIVHHGKRADAIVKGMLQHSRSSSGQKEPTDLNTLVDEYLRLSYHGLRAKDKSFNAVLKTNYDERIGKINIVPQEIGRVILNLINNAFYAVTEKKIASASSPGQPPYEPTVSVSTKKVNDVIGISVKDNGNGIPKKVLDKVFQPFFTTKPTGQGTGLGLSLSYDIIKAHGGELKVNTEEGKGSEFFIWLPNV